MTQSNVRFTIFSAWLGFLLLNAAAVLLAPILKEDWLESSDTTLAALRSVFALFLPAVSLLAGFWFSRDKDRKGARRASMGRQRAIIAIALTASYLLLATFLILSPIYLHRYPATIDPLPGETLAERLSAAVEVAAALGVVALAPIHYLTSD